MSSVNPNELWNLMVVLGTLNFQLVSEWEWSCGFPFKFLNRHMLCREIKGRQSKKYNLCICTDILICDTFFFRFILLFRIIFFQHIFLSCTAGTKDVLVMYVLVFLYVIISLFHLYLHSWRFFSPLLDTEF